MKRLIMLLAVSILLSGCTVIHIEHTYGEMPKVRIDTGLDDCKIKPKIHSVAFVCESDVWWFQ